MICLLPNCCFLSETTRMMEIRRALVQRGITPRVATHGGPHERLLREAGIAYDVLGPGFDDERSRDFVASIPGIGAPDQGMWSDEEIRTYVAAEAAYFAEHGIRLAVTGWTLTALLSTRVVGIPVVTEHAGSYLPPLFERGMIPAPSNPIGIPGERWLPRRVVQWLVNWGATRQASYTGGFNRVAAELGVAGIPSFPALLLGDLTLVTDVPEVLGIPREKVDSWTPRHPRRYRSGPRLRYTGPLYAHLDLPIPERVERFLEGPGPIVYVAITSSPPELVRRVVGALRELEVRVLVAATVHELGALEDDRVMVAGILPSHRIMPRVDLGVTAGGQGSVQTALASGLPLIGIPLQPEQDTNVALVEGRGAARLVAQRDAGGAVLRETAREMLADPRYRKEAQRIQAVFERTDGPSAAADAILELLGTGTSATSSAAVSIS
jgi:UDP:flavonoid glycosyltransferase YjiC (YdhE family)